MLLHGHEAQARPGEQPVDCLLISTPNLVVFHRLRVQLLAADICARQSPMGLEVWCGGRDWRTLLQSIALMLSDCERKDTHVALIRRSEDPSAVHRAIFRARSVERLMLEVRENWVTEVMAHDAIAIHFQPLIQYPPGRVHGYECLMRGLDDSGRVIPPSRMFEAAATMDSLRPLDEHCRMAALRQAGKVRSKKAHFFINFVPSAISDVRHALHGLMDVMRESDLSPHQVVFEVVETDRVQDQRHLQDIMRYFRKAGFKIALDDVGAGYASLLALSYLRPDYIKIDGELMRLAARSSLEGKIVADLAETARQNGIITIAEGIETERELQVAMASGIRITQGYFLCKPQPTTLDARGTAEIMRRINEAAAVRTKRGTR